MEPHSQWQDEIKRRNSAYDGNDNWYPFMRNTEEICKRISELNSHIDGLENEIGEVRGMVKNLRKILIKLEVIDDRFIL